MVVLHYFPLVRKDEVCRLNLLPSVPDRHNVEMRRKITMAVGEMRFKPLDVKIAIEGIGRIGKTGLAEHLTRGEEKVQLRGNLVFGIGTVPMGAGLPPGNIMADHHNQRPGARENGNIPGWGLLGRAEESNTVVGLFDLITADDLIDRDRRPMNLNHRRLGVVGIVLDREIVFPDIHPGELLFRQDRPAVGQCQFRGRGLAEGLFNDHRSEAGFGQQHRGTKTNNRRKEYRHKESVSPRKNQAG